MVGTTQENETADPLLAAYCFANTGKEETAVTDDAWDSGWSDRDEPDDDKSEDGFWGTMGRWVSGQPKKQQQDEGDISWGSEIEAARQRVQEFYDSGREEEHIQRLVDDCAYCGSLDCAIARETKHLERHLQHYDDEMSSYRPMSQMLTEDTWGRRIAMMNQALLAAEQTAQQIVKQREALTARQERGELSEAAYDDAYRRIGKQEQRAITRLGMGGLGGSYDEIGEVADQSAHILTDSLSDDGGAMRQKIAKKIKSMPRQMALQILAQAVEDGIISHKTARYLISQYVRTR